MFGEKKKKGIDLLVGRKEEKTETSRLFLHSLCFIIMMTRRTTKEKKEMCVVCACAWNERIFGRRHCRPTYERTSERTIARNAAQRARKETDVMWCRRSDWKDNGLNSHSNRLPKLLSMTNQRESQQSSISTVSTGVQSVWKFLIMKKKICKETLLSDHFFLLVWGEIQY